MQNINYRLNTAGFLVSQDIVNNGTSNAGLWDQRAALEWVQRNIEEFGGNPDSVTSVLNLFTLQQADMQLCAVLEESLQGLQLFCTTCFPTVVIQTVFSMQV